MKFSLIIPTYNNLEYLKLFVQSILENSNYNHQIIIHVNEGSDGTINFLNQQKIDYTFTEQNIGLCDAVNLASKKINNDYLIYAHDDMYFCKNWDLKLESEIKSIKHNLFYISGMNISYNGGGYIDFDCGQNPINFNKKKFETFCVDDRSKDLQGSHWAPHVVHKDLWSDVGGFSTEFNPGDASDPDFCLKLCNKNVRIFKALSQFKVYHFGSVTIRKNKSIIKNKGTKKFLLKWGFSPRFFRKYYLKGEGINIYNGPLSEPKITLKMFVDLMINKLKFLYLMILDKLFK